MELSLDRLAKMTPEEREKVWIVAVLFLNYTIQTVNLLRQQAVVLTFQNLIAEASDKCTRKCITNPGTILSGGEKQVDLNSTLLIWNVPMFISSVFNIVWIDSSKAITWSHRHSRSVSNSRQELALSEWTVDRHSLKYYR